MQLKRESMDRVLRGVAGFFWVSGLLAAGSDGPFMPWVNLGGVLLFIVTSIWFGKMLNQLERPRREKQTPPSRAQAIENFRPDYNCPCNHVENHGLPSQYARGAI